MRVVIFQRFLKKLWFKNLTFNWLYASLLLMCFALLRLSLPFDCSSYSGSHHRVPKIPCADVLSDGLQHESEFGRYSLQLLPEGARYMWYAPHNGMGAQVLQLKNALKIAMMLNRTLIIPPILEEDEVTLGDCSQPQLSSHELRQRSWSAMSERIADSRYAYTSIADVVNLELASPALVKTIDLRVFLAIWCGADISQACSDAGVICNYLTNYLPTWGSLDSCADKILPAWQSHLVREVDDRCNTTVWTNPENVDSRDVWEQSLEERSQATIPWEPPKIERFIKSRQLVNTLGPGSAASCFFLLSFGSLFGQSDKSLNFLVEIRAGPDERALESALLAIDALPFTEEIMQLTPHILGLLALGNRPFFCAHLEMGRSAEREKEKTLTQLRRELETLVRRQTGKVNVFVMTDFSPDIWNSDHLGDLVDNRTFYGFHSLDELEDPLLDAAHRMMLSEHGLGSGFLPELRANGSSPGDEQSQHGSRVVDLPPDIRLYVEQVICSCATLGFYGTYPSAVSSNILSLRIAQLCPLPA